MACFVVPVVESVVAAAVEKGVEKQEAQGGEISRGALASEGGIPLRAKLRWLTWLLWGGAVLLAFEHVWHGEVVPWFPFLTAMSNPADTAEMLHEMATVGVGMAALVTVVWLLMCQAADSLVKRPVPDAAAIEAEWEVGR